MSRSLKEYLTENAERLRAERQKSVVRRDEWVSAVDRLRNDIKNWLNDSDPDNLFTVKETPVTIDEEGIGTYEVKGLTVVLGPRVIHLTPFSRSVVGPWSGSAPGYFLSARGRVDLSNGLKTYSLYRLRPDQKTPVDQWFVFNPDSSSTECLDQAAFDSVMQSLLE